MTIREREVISALAATLSEGDLSWFFKEDVATLRGLLDRLKPIGSGDCDRPKPIATPKQDTTPPQGSVQPECAVAPAWLARPYYVDPPSGWLYGFPRLYDPATDGDMTEWMIRSGYPERLARQKLPCTFTAATELSKCDKPS